VSADCVVTCGTCCAVCGDVWCVWQWSRQKGLWHPALQLVLAGSGRVSTSPYWGFVVSILSRYGTPAGNVVRSSPSSSKAAGAVVAWAVCLNRP
jgi:hypothetical protein